MTDTENAPEIENGSLFSAKNVIDILKTLIISSIVGGMIMYGTISKLSERIDYNAEVLKELTETVRNLSLLQSAGMAERKTTDLFMEKRLDSLDLRLEYHINANRK
jgi:hypothetical protein